MEKSYKKVALFDLNGTLIRAHLWPGIAKRHFRAKENMFPTIWYIISHMVPAPLWKAGLISKEKYYRSWGRDTSRLMEGIEIEKAKEIFNWLTDEYLLPTLKEKVFKRLEEHQKDGFVTILVSGSFQGLLDIIAARLNMDFAIGTKLEIVGNRISGKIKPPLCLGKGKVELLKSFFADKNLDISFKESFAYSDSFLDLPMLRLVGNPIVVSPDKDLSLIAKNKDWEIMF